MVWHVHVTCVHIAYIIEYILLNSSSHHHHDDDVEENLKNDQKKFRTKQCRTLTRAAFFSLKSENLLYISFWMSRKVRIIN